eukprot:2887689-Rhodomonas_salina.1
MCCFKWRKTAPRVCFNWRSISRSTAWSIRLPPIAPPTTSGRSTFPVVCPSGKFRANYRANPLCSLAEPATFLHVDRCRVCRYCLNPARPTKSQAHAAARMPVPDQEPEPTTPSLETVRRGVLCVAAVPAEQNELPSSQIASFLTTFVGSGSRGPDAERRHDGVDREPGADRAEQR